MNHSLKHGDCLQILPTIEAGTIDAIITDPPYGIDYQSSWCEKKKPKIANDTRPFIWFLHDAYRVLKDPGCALIFCRWDVQNIFKDAMEAAGLTIKSQVIWDREGHGMGDLTGSFAPQHDVIWFGTKGDYKFPGKRPTSVIRSTRINGEALCHPNEKPVELMADLIASTVPKGGVVLDPFAGSGSTGVAALKIEREFIGIELDRNHYETAYRRLRDVPVDICFE